MKKAFFIVGGALAVLFAVAGVFYFVGAFHTSPSQTATPTIPPQELRNPDEVVVEGNRFTDTREHYSGVIPEGWEIRKPEEIDKGIDLYDQNFLTKDEGCKISSGFLHTSANSEELLKQAQEDLKYQTIKEFTVINIVVEKKPAKQATLDSAETGYSRVIYIDTPRGVFEAVLFVGTQDHSLCVQKFSNFASSLVID